MNEKTYVEVQSRTISYFDFGSLRGELKQKRVGLYRVLINGELYGFVVKTDDKVYREFTCFQLGLATLYYEGFVDACKYLD